MLSWFWMWRLVKIASFPISWFFLILFVMFDIPMSARVFVVSIVFLLIGNQIAPISKYTQVLWVVTLAIFVTITLPLFYNETASKKCNTEILHDYGSLLDPSGGRYYREEYYDCRDGTSFMDTFRIMSEELVSY
jgi:hypothetical protein